MIKSEVIKNLKGSYRAFKILKKNCDRTGVLEPLQGEREYFMNMYARLLVHGMTEEEKEEFEAMAKEVI